MRFFSHFISQIFPFSLKQQLEAIQSQNYLASFQKKNKIVVFSYVMRICNNNNCAVKCRVSKVRSLKSSGQGFVGKCVCTHSNAYGTHLNEQVTKGRVPTTGTFVELWSLWLLSTLSEWCTFFTNNCHSSFPQRLCVNVVQIKGIASDYLLTLSRFVSSPRLGHTSQAERSRVWTNSIVRQVQWPKTRICQVYRNANIRQTNQPQKNRKNDLFVCL